MLGEIKRIVAGLLLAASLYGCVSPEINKGYNAIETAVTDEGRIRNRVLVNGDVEIGDSAIGVHSLNEIDDKPETYYGRSVFTFGKAMQGTFVLKTGESGIVDDKYGVRFNDFSRFGGYGFADLSANRDSANLSVFYGRNFGKFSGELYESVEFPFDGEAIPYTEVQLYRELGKGFSIFGRVENSDFDRDKTKYLFGLVKSF